MLEEDSYISGLRCWMSLIPCLSPLRHEEKSLHVFQTRSISPDVWLCVCSLSKSTVAHQTLFIEGLYILRELFILVFTFIWNKFMYACCLCVCVYVVSVCVFGVCVSVCMCVVCVCLSVCECVCACVCECMPVHVLCVHVYYYKEQIHVCCLCVVFMFVCVCVFGGVQVCVRCVRQSVCMRVCTCMLMHTCVRACMCVCLQSWVQSNLVYFSQFVHADELTTYNFLNLSIYRAIDPALKATLLKTAFLYLK